jgi:hypothetical protein
VEGIEADFADYIIDNNDGEEGEDITTVLNSPPGLKTTASNNTYVNWL